MKQRKSKFKNIILLIIILISIIGLCTSIINIIKWKQDSTKTEKQAEKLEKIAKPTEKKDTENIKIIEQQEEIPKENPYWDYIKMNLIDVDFKKLKNINSETSGWIQINGTNINYPYVHTKDNKYYLTHSFDHSYNEAGWVFLDYRNEPNLSSQNNIIYAHGRLDQTMFGSLKNILTSNWVNNTNNYVVKLSTEYENTLWQVFSIYRIPTTSDYLQIEFSTDTEFQEFANKLLNRSDYNFNTIINETDKILTLSTCYNDEDKVVLHAKLIKRETK